MLDRRVPKQFLKIVRDRDEYILAMCKGKNVLHIGAADCPYTRERFDDASLLYVKIDKVCKEQLGIDIDEDAVSYLNKKEMRSSRLQLRDMNKLQDMDFRPDVIIMGETLEHLMNLQISFDSLKHVMTEDTELVISVPNAFYIMNFIYALFSKEQQHDDHSVAFTFKTLTALLKKNNMHIRDFAFTSLEFSRWKNLNWKGKIMFVIVRIFIHISPLFNETLLAVVKKQ